MFTGVDVTTPIDDDNAINSQEAETVFTALEVTPSVETRILAVWVNAQGTTVTSDAEHDMTVRAEVLESGGPGLSLKVADELVVAEPTGSRVAYGAALAAGEDALTHLAALLPVEIV